MYSGCGFDRDSFRAPRERVYVQGRTDFDVASQGLFPWSESEGYIAWVYLCVLALGLLTNGQYGNIDDYDSNFKGDLNGTLEHSPQVRLLTLPIMIMMFMFMLFVICSRETQH